MKARSLLPALALLAACGAPDAEPAPVAGLEARAADAAAPAEDPAAVETEADDDLSNVERALVGITDDDERVRLRNELLASSDACFADIRSELLQDGQTLIERGPLAIDRISHAIGGAREDFVFPVIELTPDQRNRLNDAAGRFYRAAGEVHDYDTDDTIYHRDPSGTQCTVVKSPEIGQPLVDTAREIQAERDAAAAVADQPDGEPED